MALGSSSADPSPTRSPWRPWRPQPLAWRRCSTPPTTDIQTKVIEYLGSGVPVVASDLPGTRDEIGDLPGVRLVSAGDRAAWEQAITAVLADDGLRDAAQRNASSIRKQFAWPTGSVREWYREVLAAPK